MSNPIDHLEVGMAEAAADQYRANVDASNRTDKVHPLGHLEKGVVSEEVHATSDEYGNVFPTEDELLNLRRVPENIPWQAWSVAFCELAERFSYYGCTNVFTNFIQHSRPGNPVHRTGAALGLDTPSGALGRGQRASTALTTMNTFMVYVLPLLGAWIADSRLGRFNTICLAVGIATVGHFLLIGSAAPDVLDNSAGALGLFIVSIIVMAFGTGFFKSNVSTLIAEQIKGKKPTVKNLKSGEKVIVDPTLSISRLFMYFYAAINIGAIVGQVGMVYAVKQHGYWLAYLLPALVFLLCIPVLAFGSKYYVKTPPAGSILSTALRFFAFAAKPKLSANPVTTVKNLFAANFWEDAKPSRQSGPLPSWMNFDDLWVDELRRAVKACQVFVFFPVYWLCYNQINNNLTSQAGSMTLNGIPNDLLSNLNPLSIIIFIPILDLFVYPLLRKAGIKFTPLKKITLGFFTASLSMVSAAVCQHYIYKTSTCGEYATECDDPAPLNVWIQTPTYVLIGFSEIFASITGLEYAFTKAPSNMKSMVMALYLFTSAIASAIGFAFVSVSADPLLVANYGIFAGLAFVFGILFWICFRKLDAEEDELNALDKTAFKSTKEPIDGRLQDNGRPQDAIIDEK
ncbi:PTR2-domain-containing protein [Microstroma glucosiphilum]|uniref:PTR2-domain-containing protein n=1 Tax=Pseudomicrostroma glucosiphilum TaxID=1684307 RepID=A0A316UGA1_9BASI|nr:PTR2-domain-containing protein [Pseudomicrostroma glucosiphilum]PWN24230.1 PTR2-domain-containing protein [Pseudomicrostroma glucosiphilum]